MNDLGFHLLTTLGASEYAVTSRMAADERDPKYSGVCRRSLRAAVGEEHLDSPEASEIQRRVATKPSFARVLLAAFCDLKVQTSLCAGLINGRNSLPLSRRSRLPTRLPLSARPHFTRSFETHGRSTN